MSELILPARDIVIASRMPPPPENHTGNIWTTEGDIVVECATCGKWGAAGARAKVKDKVDEHKKMYHPTEVMQILLNPQKG